MAETSFRFRQFTVHQDKCAMKVGTDAVLLGSWVRTSYADRILDIGTGTGVIALMLAQRTEAMIDAIDIDPGACQQAKENFRISPWFLRLHIQECPLQQFAETAEFRYDLIVSNPPYFQHTPKSDDSSRSTARNAEHLPYLELIAGVKKLLLPNGRFCVILPFKEGMQFMDLAQSNGLFCHRLARVRTVADKPEKRVMMEFDQHFGLLTEENIIIQEDDYSYSRQYIDLTKDYYFDLKGARPTTL